MSAEQYKQDTLQQTPTPTYEALCALALPALLDSLCAADIDPHQLEMTDQKISDKGLTTPLVVTQIVPWNENPVSRKLIDFVRGYIHHHTGGNEIFRREKVAKFLSKDQVADGNIFPLFLNHIIGTLIYESDIVGGNGIVSVGGATRRLAMPRTLRNGHDVHRLHFSYMAERYLTIPDGTHSDNPIENAAKKMLTNLRRPNLDLYGAHELKNMPQILRSLTSATLQFFNEMHIPYTIHLAPDGSCIEIHTKHWHRLWNERMVEGISYEKYPAEATMADDGMAMFFRPKEIITHYIIRLSLLHPEGNQNWTNIQMISGVAGKEGFLDMNGELYYNPRATYDNGLIWQDHRSGVVATPQQIEAHFYNDSVHVPMAGTFENLVPRIPFDQLQNSEMATLARLASIWSRTIRYTLFPVAEATMHQKSSQFDITMKKTLEDLDLLTQTIANRLRQGETLPAEKSMGLVQELAICSHALPNELLWLLDRIDGYRILPNAAKYLASTERKLRDQPGPFNIATIPIYYHERHGLEWEYSGCGIQMILDEACRHGFKRQGSILGEYIRLMSPGVTNNRM
ncbi:hypothetical protein HY086_03120 [Candidatus Gottesmanbacteria bacterium]|nr:hypothetical protein [Candidatus Gottesmanbacteria bacterium]